MDSLPRVLWTLILGISLQFPDRARPEPKMQNSGIMECWNIGILNGQFSIIPIFRHSGQPLQILKIFLPNRQEFYVLETNNQGQPLTQCTPESVGMAASQLGQLDHVIQNAIAKHLIPGAVLLAGRQDNIVYRKAFGHAQIVPDAKPMTTGHLFDLASLTKPIATATAIMLLVESGKIHLTDKVKQYIPEFSDFQSNPANQAESATIAHLLTHTSGMPAYADGQKIQKKYGIPCPDSLVSHLSRLKKLDAPGEKFRYSCPGYIILGDIVRRVSGMPLDEFARKNIFEPLGMQHTLYKPSSSVYPQIAATEVQQGKPLLGVVHDPLAQLMDGISGNAGLFSTADDLAIFARMLLQKRRYQGKQILSPQSVDLMTSVYEPIARAKRGLGWDVDSQYATFRGNHFSKAGFGHTGYTGTSIWVDKPTETFIILLTNRVHPEDKGSLYQLRREVADIVAQSISF